MKTISIVIPCRNERDNAPALAAAIKQEMADHLPHYNYEIIFADNCSTDGTRDVLRLMCASDAHIKAIFNARDFGQFNSPYHAMLQAQGDAVVLMCCDFQDPVPLITRFVAAWEEGAAVVCGIKTASTEGKILRWLRTRYYRLVKRMSSQDQIEHFTGFGLYDRKFIEVLRELNDPTPFLRGMVAELGWKRVDIPYTQESRRHGTSKNNFFTLYDAAMLSITSYTKSGLRVAGIVGFCLSIASLVVALVYLIAKLIWWDSFPAGSAPTLLATLVFGSVTIFLVGLLGEYVMSINTRLMNRPLVIEEERIGFTGAYDNEMEKQNKENEERIGRGCARKNEDRHVDTTHKKNQQEQQENNLCE